MPDMARLLSASLLRPRRTQKSKKKIKNLEIRKANFEVFVFTSSLAGTVRNAQPSA
jgi:hypothetical protein